MSKPINCLAVDDEPVALEIIQSHLSKIDCINLVQSCTNATEAYNCMSQHPIDLLFLDINMPGISGIAFARSINSQTKIIFTTAYREYAVEGFDLQAVDYLLKPISFPRIVKAVENYRNLYHKPLQQSNNHEPEAAFMFVKIDRQMMKIDYADIVYIESLSDYLKIHCIQKTYTVREKISSIEQKLPTQSFLRVHRSFIISINKIQSYTSEQLVLEGNSIPISRSYKDPVLKELNRLSI